MTVIPMDELVEDYLRKGATGITALAAKVAAVVAGPAYLSFDIDVLDPAFAPGTGCPPVPDCPDPCLPPCWAVPEGDPCTDEEDA